MGISVAVGGDVLDNEGVAKGANDVKTSLISPVNPEINSGSSTPSSANL